MTSLKVRDVFQQKQRLWLRLAEKGGKSKDVPCHHQLESFMADWLDASGLHEGPDAPLFQTLATKRARHGQSDDGEVAGPVATQPSTERCSRKLLRKAAAPPFSAKPSVLRFT